MNTQFRNRCRLSQAGADRQETSKKAEVAACPTYASYFCPFW
jgi:hypothetical protein